MKKICTVFFLVALGFFGKAQEFIGSKIEIAQILSNTKKFSSYVMNDDYEKIGASYTANAKIFPNRTKIIEGTDAIINYWKHPQDISITYHKITQSEIKILGEEAYDYGYYEGETTKSNGDIISWKGKYVIIWRKVNDEWKMYLDIWNGVQPQ